MKNQDEINGEKTLKKQLWCPDEGVQMKEDPGACSPGGWCLIGRWLPKYVGAKGPASILVHLPNETLYQSFLLGCLKKKPGRFLAGELDWQYLAHLIRGTTECTRTFT